ncbi:MAG: methyltransferase domain-containing protein [Eubacterium sp.]|nr:methyltransferase domain-containing protein [Eubacterium sp.]
MEAYSSLAAQYDKYMVHVPYDDWKEFIVKKFRENDINSGKIAELACGTGKMARLLAKEGYSIIASDISEEMLSEAVSSPSENVLFVKADMRYLDLGESVDGAVCVCNGMNYIMELSELTEVFERVYENIAEGGVFIFDMNSLYKFKYVMADNDVYDNREDGTFIWENFYDEKSRENQIDLTFYVECEDGRFERFEETHFQKAYELKEVTDALKTAGFKTIEIYDDYSEDAICDETEYYTFVCKKC